MRYFTRNNVLAFASCAALLFSACGDDSKNAGGSVEDQEIIAISDKTVTGVSQKGPFVNGSSVTVQELNGETLAQTGLGFEGKIKNDMGEFSVKVNKLESQYALLKANGFYRNEVTGEKSKSQVTLYALTDLSKRDEVNVNLLTHLAYERSLYLATEEDDVSVAEAKKQAETEVLKSFEIEGEFGDAEDLNIFGESDQSAALLAVSVLMQGNLSEGDFSERLANYAADIESDGVWNDTKTATQIADWAITQSMSGGLALIRNNIAGWNLSTGVPAFEKYVDNFWWQNYGLGTCDKEREGEVMKNQNAGSFYADKYFICKSSLWYVATTLEYDTYEKKCDEDGKIVFGDVNKEQPYDCDGKSWRVATEVEGKLGGCIEKRFNEVAEALETHYICENRTWREATDLEKDTYKWKEGKDADVKTGDVVKSNCYVFEDDSWRSGYEKDCTLELRGCTKNRQDTVGLGEDKVWYICDAQAWRNATDIEKDTATWGAGKNDGEIRKGQINKDTYYIYDADKILWRKATSVEYNTYQVECKKDGKMFNGKVDSTAKFVCDDENFRKAGDLEVRSDSACTSYNLGVYYVLPNQYSYYKCTEEGWIFTLEKLNQGTMTDSRDGREYKTIGIKTQMWMAENLNYADSVSYPSMLGKNWCLGGLDSCAVYGRYYTWSAAIDSIYWSKLGKTCGYIEKDDYEHVYLETIIRYDGCGLPKKVQGICPDKWHIPSVDEWEVLFSAVDGDSYALFEKNRYGRKSSDIYGFSLRFNQNYSYPPNLGSEGAYVWTSSEYDDRESYYAHISSYVRPQSFKKATGLIVRCIKDEDE